MPDDKKLYLANVQENIALAPYTTFKIGGPARYFCIAKSKQDILQAISAASNRDIPFFILGGGSNILISDQGFPGLVIKMENNDFVHEGEGHIRCGAGLIMHHFLSHAKEMGLGGVEFMAGIPGTVGGAVNGNAGAWGRGIGEMVEEALIYKDGKISIFSNKDFSFVYRGSNVKKDGGVILEVKLKLIFRNKDEIENEIQEIIKKRSKLNIQEPNAGCIFKNIDLKKTSIDKEKIKGALDLNEEEYNKAILHDKLPSGFIIDKLGLGGKAIGGAKTSEKHCAYIVNMGGAKAEDVIMLISLIKTKVRNFLGIQLEEEVQKIGF